MIRKLVLLLALALAALACSVGSPEPTPTFTTVPPMDTPVPSPPTDTPLPLPTDTPLPDPFATLLMAGEWAAIDIVDGSNMTLSFGMDVSGELTFELYDDGASACGGTPLYEFNSRGSVSFTGSNTFQITGSGVCDVTGERIDFSIDMAHEVLMDQLVEVGGQTWFR